MVRFDSPVGGKIQKERPAVVVSNDVANRLLNRVQVVPLSSRADRIYPGEAQVTVNGQVRKALANQLTTVSKRRIANREGQISPQDLAQVEAAIKVQLDLS